MRKRANGRTLQFSSRWLLAASFFALPVGCTPDPADDVSVEMPQEMAQSTCAHSICTAGTKLTSSCDPCVKKICAADSYCCNTRWSSLCVTEVGTICGTSCSGTPDMSHGGTPDLSHGGTDMSSPPADGGSGPGGVGPTGGTVPNLYFAVVGDTRPANVDDTANYPTAVIQKIYADIEGMSPRPQFVVGTGDYMFANVSGTQAAPQLAQYQHAMTAFSGTVFAAMGNHECDGYTADNCAGKTTNSLTAYLNAFVKPLGKSLPYYSVPITATDGAWNAKLLILACNDWDTTQKSWLTSQLATRTTYTFVVHHEPADATTGPCVKDVQSLLAANPYNLSLVGHTHHYQANGKEIIVGNGGAPLSGGVFGYATVEQTSSGFRVTNYDYATAAAVSSTTVPF